MSRESPFRASLFRVAGWLAIGAAILPMVWFGFFLAGVGVPKGIDDGPEIPLARGLAIDLALLLSFAFVHSLMARRAVKAKLSRVFPQPIERALYSLVAGLQILLLCWLWVPIPGEIWSISRPALRGVVWALQGLGWVIVLAALAAIGRKGIGEFFGLAQARAGAAGETFVPAPLVTRGIYRRLRHPLYAGTILAFWAAPDMSAGRALLAGVWTLYLVVGHRLEERDLERERGESYRAYRRQVPAWFPSFAKGKDPR